MKSLNKILQKSNITPYERVMTLVHNDVQKEKTGKDVISLSDIYTLTKGWSAKASEANEYNKYIEIVQLENSMKMDAQMFSYKSEVSLLQNHRVLDNFIANRKKLGDARYQSFMKDVSAEESIKFLTKNTYLEYEKVLHIHTFNHLTKEVQDDLLLLDGEVKSGSKYFEEQVFLYEQFKDGKKLSKQSKNMIVNRIYSCMYYEGSKTIKKSTKEKDGLLMHTSFADISTINIFQKIADDAGLVYGNKDIDMEDSLLLAVEECAKSANINMEDVMKEKLSLWLDDGLFVKEHTPLFMSKRHDTWNGNTTKTHQELFIIWYKALEESKQYFQELFDSGALNKKVVTKVFLGMPRKVEIVTGSSLYSCNNKIEFVQQFKEQIKILMPISSMFLFVNKHASPVDNYKTLCEFKNIAQKISSVFDIDMTYRYNNFINSYQEEITLLNHSLSLLTDIAMEHLYTEESFQYMPEMTEDCFVVDVDEKGDIHDVAERYGEEFENLKV